MTTVEQERTTPSDPAEIMPFGGWERTPDAAEIADGEVLFRFPAPDDPAPGNARLLAMALYAAMLGLAGAGVGLRATISVFGGTQFWYVPALSLLGLASVALAVGSFLSIHRPVLPWLLLAGATCPLAAAVWIAVNG